MTAFSRMSSATFCALISVDLQAAFQLAELMKRGLEPDDLLAQAVVLPQRQLVVAGSLDQECRDFLRSNPRIAAPNSR